MTEKSTPTIKEQLKALKNATFANTIIEFVQSNDHLTLKEISDALGDDKEAAAVLASTPLCDLVNGQDALSVTAKAKNGHAKKVSKKTTKKPPKNGKATDSGLMEFLSTMKKGASFKTKEYSEVEEITQQTALNRLNKSGAVKMQGTKRAAVWVVQ